MIVFQSRLLLVGLIVLAGCTTTGPGLTAFEQEQLDRRERRLATAPGRVSDPAALARIDALMRRIDPTADLRLYVLDRQEPQADLIGGEILLLHTGLLDTTHSDDELAFVLAHELGHRALGHVHARRKRSWKKDQAEIQADDWAYEALRRAGFRPQAGAELLDRLSVGIQDEAARRIVRDRRDALLARPDDSPPDPE
jgi:predicted Zn-dependent protease